MTDHHESHRKNLAWTALNAAQFPRGARPLDAIRRKCLDCSCGDNHEVAACVVEDCALWPYRMGSNPFDSRAGKPFSGRAGKGARA